MLSKPEFEAIVALANLAPSIHNAQPARWRLVGDRIEIGADRSIILPQADPTGRHIGLSCGAALEATVLALSKHGVGGTVTDLWDDDDWHSWSGHRMVARIELAKNATTDPTFLQLDQRFTWRGAFSDEPLGLYGWSRPDTAMVMDAPMRRWVADLNDAASLGILRRKAFHRELLSWMRLTPSDARYRYDGLSRDALRMDSRIARKVRLGFGVLWPLLNALGKTSAMTAEADLTRTAPLIACFHRPKDESAVQTGRAYLRLCLEETQLGLAGWPMAALTDDDTARDMISQQLAIGPERALIQVLRFGVPTGAAPPRARRPLAELIG